MSGREEAHETALERTPVRRRDPPAAAPRRLRHTALDGRPRRNAGIGGCSKWAAATLEGEQAQARQCGCCDHVMQAKFPAGPGHSCGTPALRVRSGESLERL